MARKRKEADVAREPEAAYGAWTAQVDAMPAALLEVGELHMQALMDKANAVSQTLAKAGIRHAIVGGLAVAAHVAAKSPGAERNTRDLDLLLAEDDLSGAEQALEKLGYKLRKVTGVWVFTKKGEKFVNSIHIVLAGRKVQDDYLHPAPDAPKGADTLAAGEVFYLGLPDLLKMKLTSFRLKDQVHVQDLLLTGLITRKIERTLPENLRPRLEQVKEATRREYPDFK